MTGPVTVREHDEGWMVGRRPQVHETLDEAWDLAADIAADEARGDAGPMTRVVTTTDRGTALARAHKRRIDELRHARAASQSLRGAITPELAALTRTLTVSEVTGRGWRIDHAGPRRFATLEDAWQAALALEREAPPGRGVTAFTMIFFKAATKRGERRLAAFRERIP